MKPRVAVLPGDGVGPEVTRAALRVLEACLPVETREGLVGGVALEATGDPLPGETVELCRGADAVLLGTIGGEQTGDAPARPEEGLLRLRRETGAFANLRPARYMGLPTPLREGLARHADIVVVRELSSGVYFGEPRGLEGDEAVNTWRQTAEEVGRVARVAFDLARKRRRQVCSVDKANVLETSRLWRRAVTETAADYPDVQLEHRYVDAASFELLRAPQNFDVILADNLFGDILSDEVAAVAGSTGVLASASIGEGVGLFMPVHGPAWRLAGKGVANPVGAILSVALMLEHALGQAPMARAVQSAVQAALRERRTPDVGGRDSMDEVTDAVVRHLRWSRWSDENEEEPAPNDWAV
jgi:3-isopropylmalate dehydrogenase